MSSVRDLMIIIIIDMAVNNNNNNDNNNDWIFTIEINDSSSLRPSDSKSLQYSSKFLCSCFTIWLWYFDYYIYSLSFSISFKRFIKWLLLLYSLRVFHTDSNLRFFTEIWVTWKLFRSTGLFLVAWLILSKLWSRWSRIFLWFPVTPNFFTRLFRELRLRSASPSPSSCSTTFLALWQGSNNCTVFCWFFFCFCFFVVFFLVCFVFQGVLNWLSKIL